MRNGRKLSLRWMKRKAQIDDGEAELNTKLAEGRKELNNAESDLARKSSQANKQLKDGTIKVPDTTKTIKKIEKSWIKGRELDAAEKVLRNSEKFEDED